MYRKGLSISTPAMHWVRPDLQLSPGESKRYSFRIRYRQPLQQGTLHVLKEASYIVFDQAQRGIAPGQFASWYEGDEVIGSGVID